MTRRQTSDARSAITVRRLSPDDWPIIESLFGDNGACGGCWCMWWRVPRGGKLWENQKGQPSKAAFKKLVREGKVHGCLAFSGDEPVGWCSVGPRADFPRLERTKALATEWDERTWSVVCFFIRAGWRHRGVAGALLDEAVRLAKDHGAATLEGYPVRLKSGGEVPAAFAWTGVPVLFERSGFTPLTLPDAGRDVYARRFRRRKA